VGEGGQSNRWIERIAAALLAVAGARALWLLVACVAARLPYPHELSKMEGGFVDHARWAAAGRPLYGPPTAEFVPFLYMPLAHEAGGWLVRAGLDGYTATRLVSIAGIALAIVAGMALVVRATGRWLLALLVPVLVAARYFDVECFYDQARPDDLMAGFCMVAALSLALPSARVGVPLFVASGLFAFFTKQSAALYLGVLLAGVAWRRWRVASLAGALLAVCAAVLWFWLDQGSGGWMRRYTVDIAAFHTIDRHGLLELTKTEFLNHYLLGTAAALAGAILVLRAGPAWRRGATSPVTPEESRRRGQHVALCSALGAGLFSFASSTQHLAVRNVYVLFAVALAAYLPVALDAWHRWLAARPATPMHLLRSIAPILLLTVDVARGGRDPRPWMPRPADVATWDELLDRCARLGPPERTWVMLHGAAWGGRASDPFHLHYGALVDLVGGYFGEKTGVEIPADLRERIEQRWYTSIVVGDWDQRARELLEANYERAPDLEPVKLPMFSGYGSRPSEIWVPRTGS
jgi:hypothetical protein